LEGETCKFITALTGTCIFDGESCVGEVSYEELSESYKELCIRSEEVCKNNERQKNLILQLQSEKKKSTCPKFQLSVMR
jgi:hypothetical protein